MRIATASALSASLALLACGTAGGPSGSSALGLEAENGRFPPPSGGQPGDGSGMNTASGLPELEDEQPPAGKRENLAVLEYVDMARHGTPIEREWAATARSAASPEIALAMDAALRVPEPPRADEQTAADAVADLGTRLEVDLRAYDCELRRGTNGSGVDSPWDREDVQSGAGVMSASQTKLLEHFLEREPERVRLMDRRTLELRSGEATTHHLQLPEDCVLRLRVSVSERITVSAGIRYNTTDGTVFAPQLVTTLRPTDSLLVGPEDSLAQAPRQERIRFFVLTFRSEASPPAASDMGDAR